MQSLSSQLLLTTVGNENGSLTWTSEIFPKEVKENLFDEEFDSSDYIDENGEREDEGDIWPRQSIFYSFYKYSVFLDQTQYVYEFFYVQPYY